MESALVTLVLNQAKFDLLLLLLKRAVPLPAQGSLLLRLDHRDPLGSRHCPDLHRWPQSPTPGSSDSLALLMPILPPLAIFANLWPPSLIIT